MKSWQVALIITLVILLLFKIILNGGVYKETGNPELEIVASSFEPYRNFLSEKINQLLPQPQASLLSGMLLGVKSELPTDFKNDLRETSTIHIVVVSGQNLTLVAGFVMGLAPYLGRRKTILVSLTVIIFYSLLTGLQIPVIRAAIMVGFASIAKLFNREQESTWILLLTALLMLVYNPNWLLSVSFQLSFLATIGVVSVAPVLIERFSKLPEIFKEDLAVSLAAQALTWPIIAANFHQVSIIGVLVNTLILWTVSLIMITGAFGLIVGLVNLLLGQIVILVPAVFLTYFVYIVSFFGI